VAALAEHIKAAQQPEIDAMNSWLDTWGRTQMDDGGMHHVGGGGMMTELLISGLGSVRAELVESDPGCAG
jgi:uncharacterized protein (DUF305 family)